MNAVLFILFMSSSSLCGLLLLRVMYCECNWMIVTSVKYFQINFQYSLILLYFSVQQLPPLNWCIINV